MKKPLTALATVLLLTACTQTADTGNNGMMQGDKMQNCRPEMGSGMMQKGMMRGGMPMSMMAQCPHMQGGMMQNGMMQGGDSQQPPAVPASKSAVNKEDHKKHHPAQ